MPFSSIRRRAAATPSTAPTSARATPGSPVVTDPPVHRAAGNIAAGDRVTAGSADGDEGHGVAGKAAFKHIGDRVTLTLGLTKP